MVLRLLRLLSQGVLAHWAGGSVLRPEEAVLPGSCSAEVSPCHPPPHLAKLGGQRGARDRTKLVLCRASASLALEPPEDLGGDCILRVRRMKEALTRH